MPEDTIRYLRNEIKGKAGRISDLKHKLKFATAVDAKREVEIATAVDKYDKELLTLRNEYRRERRELNLEILRLREQVAGRSNEVAALRSQNEKLTATAEAQQAQVATRDVFARAAVERVNQSTAVAHALAGIATAATLLRQRRKPPSKLAAGRFGSGRSFSSSQKKKKNNSNNSQAGEDMTTALVVPGKLGDAAAEKHRKLVEQLYTRLETAQARWKEVDMRVAATRVWDPQELYVGGGYGWWLRVVAVVVFVCPWCAVCCMKSVGAMCTLAWAQSD